MIPLLQKHWPVATEVWVAGRPLAVAVRVSARARSYRLSLPLCGAPRLTVPKTGRWSDARAFLDRHSDWLAERLALARPPVAFEHGAVVPLRGVDHRLVPTDRARGLVVVGLEDGGPALFLPGAPAHRKRRLFDWLKTEAERDLTERCRVHAERLGVSVAGVAMRNQATRWGSCSSSGRLNFNWRLILAPPFVLDYVAAHEVAHLVEMNHSPAFWAAVVRALPTMAQGRDWLRAHGRDLMAYGRNG